ncbi:MAG TPA: ABC transporter permease [Saprospiraceae bacterium]|nr:ABC transporter permease [Saprospiraceae bacterium]HMQ85416.1 ABC transporter permease [Saprospiraceae bacterium]
MLHHYLLIALRNLLKQKLFSGLNIVGLAIGIAVFLLIALYVHFERSYESFLPQADDLYRVALERYHGGELMLATAENVPGVGPAMQQEIPEVESYARLYNLGYKNNLIITNEAATPQPIAFKHRRFLYADSSFLSMMGYEMAVGDPATALAAPFKAVISEEYAKKYFGTTNPIGQHLRMQDDDFNDEKVEVSGVFKNLPANTHLKFDVLFSYKTLFTRGNPERSQIRYGSTWDRNDMYTFVKLKAGTNPKTVAAKLPALLAKYSPSELAENNRKDVLYLQPLRDIHLYSDLAEEPEPNGDARIVWFMAMIGILVLMIAWINYINLSTARALERAREVGVRKVAGARRAQLIGQFLLESALINGFAVLFAFMLTALAIPGFNSLTGLRFSLNDLFQGWLWLLLLGIWIAGTLLSGFYPATVLAAFRPIAVLKGQLKHSSGGLWLRKGLVVAQFTASVALIASTFILHRQLRYLLHQDLGVNIDEVLVVERPGIAPRENADFQSAIDVFRAELLKNPDLSAVAASFTVPGKQREYKAPIRRLGAPAEEAIAVRANSMDYYFMDIFEMQLLAGRVFSADFPSDQDTSCILTESATRLLGFAKPEDAIGHTLSLDTWQWHPIVVGVVNDYHQVSLKKALEPTLFFCSPYQGEFYSIRVKTNHLAQTIDHVQQSWELAFPGNPFEYFFLDEYFAAQYQNEARLSQLSTVFALLSILVGCLGLFGLSGYTVAQRTKEIGIRKVLGASTSGLLRLLSKDILQLVGVAILLAIPLSWWAMEKWLLPQTFGIAHRIGIEWWIFALAGATAILIAFLTISMQSLKATRANPVESLRRE